MLGSGEPDQCAKAAGKKFEHKIYDNAGRTPVQSPRHTVCPGVACRSVPHLAKYLTPPNASSRSPPLLVDGMTELNRALSGKSSCACQGAWSGGATGASLPACPRDEPSMLADGTTAPARQSLDRTTADRPRVEFVQRDDLDLRHRAASRYPPQAAPRIGTRICASRTEASATRPPLTTGSGWRAGKPGQLTSRRFAAVVGQHRLFPGRGESGRRSRKRFANAGELSIKQADYWQRRIGYAIGYICRR